MFGHLGLHVISYPTGRFGFVGTVPAALGDVVPASTADVMAGRAFTAPDKSVVTLKFPTFPSGADAVAFAASKGFTASWSGK